MSQTSLSDSIDKEKTVYVTKGFETTNGVVVDVDDLRHINDRFDGSFKDDDLVFISGHMNDLTFEQALEVVRNAAIDHDDDPSIDRQTLELLRRLPEGPLENQSETEWEQLVRFEAFLVKEWSVYPEVRAVTRPIDEPGDYCETLRVYVIGLFLACAGSCLATFFFNRFPQISISLSAIQLLIVCWGQGWARLPNFKIPIWPGKKIDFNPGPWSFKEQTLCSLAVSVSLGAPYSQYTITAQQNDNFYGFTGGGFGYMIMFTLSSQMMGFGIAGIMRTFLVYPEQCVWFSVLPTIALNRALMENEDRTPINGWRIKRWECFVIFSVFSFCWYWVTNFLLPFLQMFDWPAWISPRNVDLQAMTGMVNGLSLHPITTFDWNTMDQSGMITPFYSTANMMFGSFIGMFAILVIWYTNVCNTGYLPINSNSLFNNEAKPFSVTKVLDAQGKLDEAKYQKYSLPYYTAGSLVVYGSFFMIYPAMVVYAILNYGGIMLKSVKMFGHSLLHPSEGLKSHHDRFSRAQQKYREVPEWWFLVILLGSFGMAVGTVEYYKFTQTPVWTIVFGAVLALIFTIPFGLLYSVTNQSFQINVLIELIIGYIMPGNGNALMIAKSYATEFSSQTDNYITNQVQAHYTGIPPRALFRVQMLSVIVVTFVQVGLIFWQLNGGIPGFCDPDNVQKFTCQSSRTFFNAGVIWGTIGPKRVFDTLYPSMKYTFLIGAFFPVPFWLARRFLTRMTKAFDWLYNINELLWVAGSISTFAPYNFGYWIPNFYLSFIFNYWIKRRAPIWWAKYNYVILGAMRVGVAYGALIMFFSTGYKHFAAIGGEAGWWGSNVMYENLDAGLPILDSEGNQIGTEYAVRLHLAEGEYFGPRRGHFP